MKKVMFLLSMLGGISLSAQTQQDVALISTVVEKFSAAGDAQDADALTKIIDDNYRIVWNNVEKGTVTVLDKTTYLGMIRDKKVGGDKRDVQIEAVELIDGGNALVRATLTGTKADFSSLYSLVKNDKGEWHVVQDQVFMQMK